MQNIIEKLFELSKNAYALKSDLNELQKQIRILAVFMRNYIKEPSYIKKNALIVRCINSMLKKGFNYEQAVYATSVKLHEPMNRCLTVYNVEKHRHKQFEKLATLYMIEKLEKNNFSKPQIAKITGYSVKYIYELKKRNNERQKTN